MLGKASTSNSGNAEAVVMDAKKNEVSTSLLYNSIKPLLISLAQYSIIYPGSSLDFILEQVGCKNYMPQTLIALECDVLKYNDYRNKNAKIIDGLLQTLNLKSGVGAIFINKQNIESVVNYFKTEKNQLRSVTFFREDEKQHILGFLFSNNC